jgi:hypothetical protein
LQDEKKQLEVKIFFKSPYMRSFADIKDTTFVLAPPPMKAGGASELNAGDQLDFSAALGVSPTFLEIGGDLDVESEDYFEKTAKKGKKFEYTLKMTGKANNIKDKNGKEVNIHLTDPRTGQSYDMPVIILPKPTKGKGKGLK